MGMILGFLKTRMCRGWGWCRRGICALSTEARSTSLAVAYYYFRILHFVISQLIFVCVGSDNIIWQLFIIVERLFLLSVSPLCIADEPKRLLVNFQHP